jgi:hypothetical protein
MIEVQLYAHATPAIGAAGQISRFEPPNPEFSSASERSADIPVRSNLGELDRL